MERAGRYEPKGESEKQSRNHRSHSHGIALIEKVWYFMLQPGTTGNPMSSVATTHIEIDERGVAWITGANTKVIEVVLDKLAYGWSPEEIHFQHSYLSLAQIHAALTYYYDHHVEIDGEIARQLREVEPFAEAAKDSPGRRRLHELGLRP